MLTSSLTTSQFTALCSAVLFQRTEQLGKWRMDVEMRGKQIHPFFLLGESLDLSVLLLYHATFLSLVGCFEEAKGLSGSEIIEHCVIERLEMHPVVTHQLPVLFPKNCCTYF